MEKKWKLEPIPTIEAVERLRSELKVSPTIATILLQRGITNYQEAERFFRPNLEHLHDPFLMKGMDKAVERLIKAIQKKENILLYGDYDVDGTSSVAMMYSYLSSIHQNLNYYIPDRYKEGYGLSKQGIDYAKENNFQLMILLDCGIKSVELVEYGKSLGIDFIICDHHEPGEIVPNTIVLDPKQVDCSYPYKELCGCGVGFKLIQAYILKEGKTLDKLYELLDFVAIAIGADIVPVTGENRVLAHHGMRILNNFTRPSFQKMFDIANRPKPYTLTDVVFSIAPRINAAGRLYSGMEAVKIMTAKSAEVIEQLAQSIEQYNIERKELDEQTTNEALEIINNDAWYKTSHATVVYKEDWHKGVVGIVASRIIEKVFKPTIVLTENNGMLTGSARSINQFDLYKALSACEDLLEQYGGHAFAAGMTLKKENFNAFRERFDDIVGKQILLEDKTPIENINLSIDLSKLYERDEDRLKVPKLKRILMEMEPFGPGNMKPVFQTSNVYSQEIRLLKEKHLKLKVTQVKENEEIDVIIDGIGFNLGNKENIVAKGLPYDIIYTLETNTWREKTTLQLNIKDIRSTIY
jgi:single-stranded-DNA-specific exonuclease